MWVPESMTRYLFATPKDDLTQVLEFFGKEGKFHLEEFKREELEKTSYGKTYQNLNRENEEIQRIIQYFGIKRKKEPHMRAVDATEVDKEAKKFLNEFQDELGMKRDRLKALKEKETELNLLSEILALLPDEKIPIQELIKGRFFKMKGGTIPLSEKEILKSVIQGTDVAVWMRPPLIDKIPIVAIYPISEEETAKKILDQARFSESMEFNKLKGKVSEVKDSIEIGFWEIKEERANIQNSIKKMGENVKEKILAFSRDTKIALTELGWIGKMSRTENVFFINTYIPSEVTPKIKKESRDLDLYILSREKIQRNSKEAKNTPTKLNNPGFFRPFESFVKTYSIPSYQGIDPTILTSITFLLMFGAMFGDLGHGIVLLLCGIGLYFLPILKKYALLPITMGISSCIFGILFGEFFGTHPFEPLWFSPFENTERTMMLGVYLGMGMIASGFIIKIIEGKIRGDREEIFLSGESLPGLIFYISLVFLAFGVVKNIPKRLIIIEGSITGVSILVIALGKPIMEAIKEGLNTNDLLLSLSNVAHLSLAMIANALSFIRVSAFNIGHAALTLSIIQIGNLLGEMIGGGEYLTLFLGNLIIIVLEGMIVFIQALRLEYYEFYSRFFEKGKREYKPIKIS